MSLKSAWKIVTTAKNDYRNVFKEAAADLRLAKGLSQKMGCLTFAAGYITSSAISYSKLAAKELVKKDAPTAPKP